MDKKLFFICLLTGIAMTVFTIALVYSGSFFISLSIPLLLPGVTFGYILSLYFKDIVLSHKVIFTSLSFIIYTASATIIFFKDEPTEGLILLLFSTFSLPLMIIIFNKYIKKVILKKSLIFALLGGFLSGLIIFLITFYISKNPNYQGENGAVIIILSKLLIFPFWQTAFALSIHPVDKQINKLN